MDEYKVERKRERERERDGYDDQTIEPLLNELLTFLIFPSLTQVTQPTLTPTFGI